MIAKFLFAFALMGLGANSAAVRVPYAETAADDLAPAGLTHNEVLRIERDFGQPQFEIVVDSWSPRAHPDAIREVRIWWVKTHAQDRRSPFGKKLRRYIELDYVANEPGDWTVRMRGDRKEFAFDVEVDARGNAAAYGDVITESGARIDHCRAESSRLVARRFLGLPIGIKRLEIQCTDATGRKHLGSLPYRKLKRGRLYKDE